MPDVYHIEGMKHNLLSIGQLIQKGYRVYMEDNHCVIKDKHPSNQLITKVSMTRNHLFPLSIIPYIKGKRNIGVVFKVERKEADKHRDKEEKYKVEFQATFQLEVQDESWL